MTNKDGKKVQKNSELKFIHSCRFIASSLEKLKSDLCDIDRIHYNECKGNMEFINTLTKYIESVNVMDVKQKRLKIK